MKKFNCIACDFHTNHKPNFQRHLGSMKHSKKNSSHPKVTQKSPLIPPKVTQKSPKIREKTPFFAKKMKKRTNHWKKRTIYINANIV